MASKVFNHFRRKLEVDYRWQRRESRSVQFIALFHYFFCLQISSRSSFQLTSLITAPAWTFKPKKSNNRTLEAIINEFSSLFRIRQWFPCPSRFNSSWINVNIPLRFHLKSSIPSWLRKFFSSFEHINFAENEKIQNLD